MGALVHQHLKAKNIELYLGHGVKSFVKRGSRIILALSSGAELGVHLVVLTIGVRPETRLALDAGLTLDCQGCPDDPVGRRNRLRRLAHRANG